MHAAMLRCERSRVLPVLFVIAAVVIAVSCGGGADPSRSESLAAALPTEPTSLPLQPNAPAVGGDVQAPLQDMARLQITEAQAKEMAEACRDASEIVASSECTSTIRDSTENAPPCAAKQLCITAAKVGAPAGTAGGSPASAGSVQQAAPVGSAPHGEAMPAGTAGDQQVSYIIAITDERPGSPLCSDAPAGLCFVLPADDEAAADVVNNARFAQSTLPEPEVRESRDAGPPTSPAESPETQTGNEREVPNEQVVPPTQEPPPTTEPASEPPPGPESPPVDQSPAGSDGDEGQSDEGQSGDPLPVPTGT
ncbi:hypothetical protein CcI49_19410 [Frankia sp. CcI49]|uniref:hypothetical protein n=1 Tax=Frankia sp. CcI49 TaxID=1745382 RepID=UPI0009768C54|nr:hypothetical protein [Frankia sp. CcI49]ONH58889.1 hypothetical protein CcI49_19410 [Frankia sp. CcI49]